MSGFQAISEEMNKSVVHAASLSLWQSLEEKLSTYLGTVMVLGGTDTGKTTLARSILEFGKLKGLKTGLLELDMGQSEFGPPTSCTLHLPFLPHSDLHYFVGRLSPAGAVAKCLAACVCLFRQARENRVQLLVVDPTGLIEGGLGVWLKRTKIEFLSPALIIGIEKNTELSSIFYPFRFRSDLEILSYKPLPEVRSHSREERAELRKKKFLAYFSQLEMYNLSSASLFFLPNRQVFSSERDGQRGRVLGLLNDRGWLERLAILWETNPDGGLVVLAPPLDIKRVRAVETSSILLEHSESFIIQKAK